MGVNETKQVIVARADLGMSRGKLAAQVAHGSIAFLTEKIQKAPHIKIAPRAKVLDLSPPESLWIGGSFKKIVLRVESEDELLEIHKDALRHGRESHLIKDNGLTEFSEPTYTVCAIGPDYSDRIDWITGHLKTFR